MTVNGDDFDASCPFLPFPLRVSAPLPPPSHGLIISLALVCTLTSTIVPVEVVHPKRHDRREIIESHILIFIHRNTVNTKIIP